MVGEGLTLSAKVFWEDKEVEDWKTLQFITLALMDQMERRIRDG